MFFFFWGGGGKVLFESPLLYNSTPTADFVIPALVSILRYKQIILTCDILPKTLISFSWGFVQTAHVRVYSNWGKNRITLKHILQMMVQQFDENVWGYTNSPDCYSRPDATLQRERNHSVFQIRDASQVNDPTKKASWPNKWHISIKLNIAKKH